MKNISIFWIAILISICSFSVQAQEKTILPVKEICIPESVITKVIDDLIIKDHLQFTVNVQDSILHVYQHSDSISQVEIKNLKLNATEYVSIINKQKEIESIDKAKITDLEKQIRKRKIKTAVIDTLQYTFVAILTWIAIKNSIN